MRTRIGFCLAAYLSLAGCTALDVLADPEKAARRAAQDVAQEAASQAMAEVSAQMAQAVADAILARFQPEVMSWLGQVALHNPTMNLAQADDDYRAGEYTEWEWLDADGEPAGVWMRRAYLGETDEGQWWQLRWGDPEGSDEMIMESLLDPEIGQTRRMLLKPGKDEAVQEVSLEESQAQGPRRLDADALAEQARESHETIAVPAGRFDTRRLALGEDGEGFQTWWLNDSVPGQVVQFQWQDPEGEEATLQLRDYGSGASTELRDR
ncbi:hypothetical protein J2T60_002432 [Natronospira proteinivora]|uniref:Lipoprotein n=1 Tax=Natronospira proteinivora TaxID=1807133 RepID=A0ABT1GAV0_9GAMM|nr:hypothetical protein [Natronospira proteinivora]MCP1728432.1 hypothetical protein [Natronospira proteinivora]